MMLNTIHIYGLGIDMKLCSAIAIHKYYMTLELVDGANTFVLYTACCIEIAIQHPTLRKLEKCLVFNNLLLITSMNFSSKMDTML